MPDFDTITTTASEGVTSAVYINSSSIGTTTIDPIYTSFTSPIYFTTREDPEEKIKEYAEKVDQHVDQLEEDIEFLNNKREEQQNLVQQLYMDNINKSKCIADLETKIDKLEAMVGVISDLLRKLEDKIK